MTNDTLRPKYASVTLRIDEPTVQIAQATKRPREHVVLNVLAGPSAGMLHVLDTAETTIGRDLTNGVVLADIGVSSRHARIGRTETAYFIEDLKSTNGTFLNGERIDTPHVLIDGDRVQLGQSTVLGIRVQDETELEAARKLYDSVVRDALTGLYNRRHLEERLHAEWAFAARHRTPLALLILDIDYFKQVNDTHGHLAGDAVLKAVGRTLMEVVRTEDLAARYGGEEFVVLARGIDLERARMLGERLRRAVERTQVIYEGVHIPVTTSVGIAVTTPEKPMQDRLALLAHADGALYRAKDAGRNRVETAD